jgi:hypothetical protein
VIAESDQLVIRNIRNTHRVAWSQIEDIDQAKPGTLAAKPGNLRIHLSEGSIICVTLYSNSFTGPGYQGQMRRIIKSLKELQRQRV